jgi:hypothetical protein
VNHGRVSATAVSQGFPPAACSVDSIDSDECDGYERQRDVNCDNDI